MGRSKCAGSEGHGPRGVDSSLVWSSPDTSGVGKFPDESFEQVSSFFVVLESAETWRGRRQQADLTLLGPLIRNLHSLLHIAYEKRLWKHLIFRMRFDRLPKANTGCWK